MVVTFPKRIQLGFQLLKVTENGIKRRVKVAIIDTKSRDFQRK